MLLQCFAFSRKNAPFYLHNRLIDPQTQVTRISVSLMKDCGNIYSRTSLFYFTFQDERFSHVQCYSTPTTVSFFLFNFFCSRHVLQKPVSQFQLREVCQFAAHQENGRLMGFVVEGRDWSDGDEEGQPSFSAFIFESNTEGEKVRASNAHLLLNSEEHVKSCCTNDWRLRLILCFYPQICYTISLAKDITEAKKVPVTPETLLS